MKFLKIILLLLGVYVIVLLYVYFNQTNILFQPETSPWGSVERCDAFSNFERINNDGTTLFVHKRSPTKAIVFYHGNAGTVCHRSAYVPVVNIDDYTLIFVEYESFTNESIKPSLLRIRNDASKTVKWLAKQGYEDVVIVGRSLGSIPATAHAQIAEGQRSVKGVVLISPVSLVSDVASAAYWFLPVKQLLREDASTIENLQEVDSPIFVIAGSKDTTVPDRFSQKLYDSLITNNRQYLLVEGAKHNNIIFFIITRDSIVSFIQGL